MASYASWEPKAEPDDERPILPAEPDAGGSDDDTSPLPRYTVQGEVPVAAGPAVDVEGEEGFVQMFVNVGKREGVRSADLQKLLADRGLTPSETSRIRIRDRMTFVSVKKEAIERAVAAVSGQVIGGRTVVAELARARPTGGGGRGSRS